ncbi:MAG: hypothetical protein KGQ49_03115 [Verrucomicrobia bacterium]|nr:hypothetical protein [Verrucomicrobiota bacterium]
MGLYVAYALWEICRKRPPVTEPTESPTTLKKAAHVIAPLIAGIGYELGRSLMRAQNGAEDIGERGSTMGNMVTEMASVAHGALGVVSSIIPATQTVILGLGMLATAALVYRYCTKSLVENSSNNTIHNVVNFHVELQPGTVLTQAKQPDGSTTITVRGLDQGPAGDRVMG